MLIRLYPFRDSKAFYRYANNRLRGSCPVPALKDNLQVATSDDEKAEWLSRHFSSVFCNSAPPSGNQGIMLNVQHPDTAILFDEFEVYTHLSRLAAKFNFTPDGIPPLFYREFALFLCEPLTLIFNASFNEGSVPDAFRCGIVTPIHKRGPKCLTENYRPVNQSCIASAIMEKVVSSRITNHLSVNGLFDPAQHGFVPRRSTCIQLLTMTNDWARVLNRGENIRCVMFDQKAAFDRINHELLIAKLTRVRLHAATICLVRDYLRNRSFRVRVGTAPSSP